MNYDDAIKILTSKGNFYIDLGLERISSALEKLGNPQDNLKCIHVAGTNGKGSVCAVLASVLQEAGYNVGLYTSPHIFDYTERIRINGNDISKEKFAEYAQKVFSVGIHLTEFEIHTVIMFLYFNDEKVDFVVLETGMGGRLDATNVIKQNLCSIITQIDLDHTERLGKTKEAIAYEKAGIIKKGCPVITSMGYETIRDKADKEDSMLIFVSPFINPIFVEALSLKGKHQEDNLALVLTAVQYLFPEITEKTILEGLRNVKHHFRFEYFSSKNLIVDASHNPNGIKALRENLDLYYPNQKRRFVFGCLKNKDYKQMLDILLRDSDEIYFYGFDYPNACAFEDLTKECRIPSKEYTDFNCLTDDKLNIICGSFYMIGTMSELKYLL